MSAGLGSFRVGAKLEEATAFRKAIGLDGDSETLPLTYPMRWLVLPEVRAALIAMIPEPDLVLVHESQSFEYKRSLRCDETYVLSLSARRDAQPDRLLVDGTLVDGDGDICVNIETILRLFSTELAA